MKYDPITDVCRVCLNPAPHEWRVGERVEIICRECKTLLESLPNVSELTEALTAADEWSQR